MNKVTALLVLFALIGLQAKSQEKQENLNQKNNKNMEKTNKGLEYTFTLSDKVVRQKVTFKNRYGVIIAGDLYQPKVSDKHRMAAIAVSGPFGAVKEQASGLYAMIMAERGFKALAFDPLYTGESDGEPRNLASPEINTENFSAAVDFWASKKC